MGKKTNEIELNEKLSREDEVSVDVDKHDQDRINTFASQNGEVKELQAELKVKKVRSDLFFCKFCYFLIWRSLYFLCFFE